MPGTDVFEEPLWKPWVYLAKEYDFRGCWSFPIKTRENKAVGTFAMYFRTAREATPRDLALADVVTQAAAVIIANHSESQERARAEEALHKSEALFRTIVMASWDVVYQMSPDWKEMRYLKGKDFLAETEETSSRWIETYILDEDQPRVLATIEEAIRTKSVFELEHRVIRVDGTVGWTHSRAIPVLSEQGEIVEWFGTAKDVTEHKRAEAVLRGSERA